MRRVVAAPHPSAPARPGPADAPAGVPSAIDRLHLGDHRGAVRLDVAVKPRSSRSAVLGVKEGALEVALRAAPVEGAANDELRALLAKVLEVRKGDVEVVIGASSRGKVIQVHGIDVGEASARLARATR